MICLICKKLYVERRSLLTIFSEPITIKCHSCRTKHRVFPYEIIIPVWYNQLYMTTIFMENNNLSEDAFMLEIGTIFESYYQKMRKNDLLLFVDSLSEEQLFYFDQISFGDIYLISLYPSSFLI